MNTKVLLLAFILVGCAPMIWDKSGATQDDYNRDSSECEKDARQNGYYGNELFGTMNMMEFLKRCMVSKGYTLRED
jgi:hypothetical protein